MIINENYKAIIIEYNIEEEKWQAIKDWKMHYGSKDITQIQLEKIKRRRLHEQLIKQQQNKKSRWQFKQKKILNKKNKIEKIKKK